MDEAVAIAQPMLVLRAHALVMRLGAYFCSPDIAVIGVVLRLGDFDPLLFVGHVDFVDTCLILVVVDFHLFGSFQIRCGICQEPY